MGRKVMLLVDADNVSADVIQQAFERVMAAHGAVHVRRAYCTAESAAKHLPLFKRLSMRPIVNVSTGKNSTDIALAVDAISLVDADRPDVVVIVSSDSDFAPLVIRLREKGCRVEGIGQQGKTGEDSIGVYDDFADLAHRKAPPRALPKAPNKTPNDAPTKKGSKPKPSREAATESRSEAQAAFPAADAPAAKPTPKSSSRAAPAKRSAASKAVTALPAAPRVPDDVLRVLEAVPALRSGQKVELRVAAEGLRAAGLLSKSGVSTKLFRKHAEHFVLTPDRQPNKVQYQGPALA